MMNVKLNENILTVVTPITKTVADKAFSGLTLIDEKTGDVLCSVTVSPEGKGLISSCGLVCNSVVEGKLAVVLTMPMSTSMEDVKKLYGKALVKVNKYIDQVAENAEKEIEAIDGIFAE